MKSPGTEEFRKVGRGVLEGRKCWFAVESKTFEISIEEVREGVESWCRGESNSRCLKVWEGGRSLDRSVVQMKLKLRALGVSTPALSQGNLGTPNPEKDGCSIKGNEEGKGAVVEVARVKIGEPRDSLWVHEWALERWSLKGGLKISKLGEALVLFEFENKCEADLVLLRVVDDETTYFSQLQWARILVRASGKNMPSSLQCRGQPSIRKRGYRIGMKGEGDACACGSEWDFQIGDQSWGQKCRPRTARWEAFKENGRMGSSGAGEWDRSPNPENPGGGGRGGHVGLEHELLAADGELLSSCLKLTDTALLEEASRYPADPKLSFSLGFGFLLLLFFPWGPTKLMEGVSSGAEGLVEGAMDRIPLRVVRIEDLSALSG
ncbi:hypothetical protein CK203_043513 [Vitis vinifera]|uniref:DUF4283 domain-containing protein n=1 Tax=Vitis vinifera TaxID=29760 RepID=A0A438HRC1_VITVI|nr:hypothetical protein CK203_043513 [Vitis vinifera]